MDITIPSAYPLLMIEDARPVDEVDPGNVNFDVLKPAVVNLI